MIDITLVIAIMVFVAVILMLLGIFHFRDHLRKREDIINKIKNEEPKSVIEKTREIISTDDRSIKNLFLHYAGSLGSKIRPDSEEEISNTRKLMLQAGFRRYNAPLVYLGLKVFLAVLFPVLFWVSRVFIAQYFSHAFFIVGSLLLCLCGFYLPNLLLMMRISARKEKILEGFPDALDLMVVCVEAGMGLDAAINRVGEEMRLRNYALSEEFRVLSLELRAGKLRRDALRNLALRTGLDDVHSLMTLLIQTDKFGTSIAQALRVHSDSIRTKRYQRAEEIAAKLPVKLVFPLVLFIFPALFVVIVGPAIIKIYRVLFPLLGGE